MIGGFRYGGTHLHLIERREFQTFCYNLTCRYLTSQQSHFVPAKHMNTVMRRLAVFCKTVQLRYKGCRENAPFCCLQHVRKPQDKQLCIDYWFTAK